MDMSPSDQSPHRSFAGHLLLAMQDMPDPNFRHAAIALCVHDANGAMGIDLGTAIDGLGIHALFANFGIEPGAAPDIPVLRGGPVEPRRGFILHSLDWEDDNMIRIGDTFGLSGSLEVLRDIAAGKGPSRYVAALGYAGWAAGQLEAEMGRPGWFVGAVDADTLFATDAADRWARAFARNGVDPAHLTAQSGRA